MHILLQPSRWIHVIKIFYLPGGGARGGVELFTLHKQTFAEAPESRGFSLPTSRSLLMLHQIRFNKLSRTLKAGLSVARSVGCCCGRASPPGTANRLSGHGKSSVHHVHGTHTLEMCSACFSRNLLRPICLWCWVIITINVIAFFIL